MLWPIVNFGHRQTYVGPGDVVSGALAFYSCGRAYNAAYASANSKLCNIRRTSDGQTCDLLAAANGGPGVTANCSGAANGQSTEAYDQSGNGVNVSQSTTADQPQLELSGCSNTAPCVSNTASTVLSGGTIGASAQPWTMAGVAEVTSGSGLSLLSVGSSFQPSLGMNSTGGAANGYAGSGPITETATTTVFHELVFVGDGASSFMVVDGVASSLQSAGADTLTSQGTAVNIGTGVQSNFIGQWSELEIYSGALTSTQYGNLHTNQHAYWGTTT